MLKLVRKLARLGAGAPWIFKIMPHLYTSLAFALKSNAKLIEKSSSGYHLENLRKYGRVAGVLHNSDFGQTVMTADRLQTDRPQLQSE